MNLQQGLPAQLAALLEGHVDRFLGNAEALASHANAAKTTTSPPLPPRATAAGHPRDSAPKAGNTAAKAGAAAVGNERDGVAAAPVLKRRDSVNFPEFDPLTPVGLGRALNNRGSRQVHAYVHIFLYTAAWVGAYVDA